MKEIPQCKLVDPATCIYMVDGKLSHIMLCGGNPLEKKIAECSYRYVDYIRE